MTQCIKLGLPMMLAAALAFGACGSDSMSNGGGADAPPTGGPDAPSSGGPTTHYVTSSLKVGATSNEAASYAIDLDNDPQHHKDNALGGLLASLKMANIVDIDSALATALSKGDVVILHSLKGDLATAASATWQVYVGAPQANPDLTSGNGQFTIDTSSPRDAKLPGSVAGGAFSGGPAKVTLQLAVVAGQPAITVPLIGTRIEAQVSAAGCMSGRLGGGIKKSDLDGSVIPAIAALLTARVHADAGCPSHCNDPANTSILTFLDTDPMDGTITGNEISGNQTVSGFLAPDVDLLDAAGNAGHDGTKDSVSIAVGFGCTKATFTE